MSTNGVDNITCYLKKDTLECCYLQRFMNENSMKFYTNMIFIQIFYPSFTLKLWNAKKKGNFHLLPLLDGWMGYMCIVDKEKGRKKYYIFRAHFISKGVTEQNERYDCHFNIFHLQKKNFHEFKLIKSIYWIVHCLN